MSDIIGDITGTFSDVVNKAGTAIFGGIADLITIANKELTPIIGDLMFTAFNIITEFIIYGVKKILIPLVPFIGGLLVLAAIAIGIVVSFKFPHNHEIEKVFNNNWNPIKIKDKELPTIDFNTYIEYMKIKATDAVPWLVSACLGFGGIFLIIVGCIFGYGTPPTPPNIDLIVNKNIINRMNEREQQKGLAITSSNTNDNTTT